MRKLSVIAWFAVIVAAGCTEETVATDDDGGGGSVGPSCQVDTDCAITPGTPLCNAGQCEALPAGHAIGWRDGSPTSVVFVALYGPEAPMEATDLAFHPTRPEELWVLRRFYEESQPCIMGRENQPACTSLPGSIAVINNPGLETGSAKTYVDRNAWHFMRRPTALAFGDNGTFATVAEAQTGNYNDDPLDYMGPSLWSSDLPGVVPGCESAPGGCFSIQPSGKNGSHLDMLHETPFGMGIAHEQANIYWTFNGQIGAIDRYDFHIDHGPGNDDHSDGEISRYVKGQLTRVPNIPSHMEFDHETAALYIADTGGQRIVALDTTSGTPGGSVTPNYDGLVNNREMDGATLTEIVPAGVLQAPSGLALYEGVIYVTDNATSRIHAFSRDGEELNVLDTGFPPGSLAGLTIGPDGKAYFVEKPTGVVLRIDPF